MTWFGTYAFPSSTMPATIREKNGGITKVIKLEDDRGWILLHSSGKARITYPIQIETYAMSASMGVYLIE